MTERMNLPKSFSLPHTLSGMKKNTPILVALSGGADSTALLHMLYVYKKMHGAEVYAAHINHGIRGEEADRDENFCKELCKRFDIKFFVKKVDVPKIAKELKESVETAARNIRYDFFDEIMEQNKIPILATAHNANDNLETMLFNLARGTALGGMCGIPPVRPCKNGTVIRPIISMTKDEIIAYCRENELSYVTDSTNTDTEYTRNMIRSEIIPRLQKVNGGAIKNASRTAQALRADSLYIEKTSEGFICEHCIDGAIQTEKLNGKSEAITNRVLISLYKGITGKGNLETIHLSALRELSRKAIPHSSVTLPDGIEAVIEDGSLTFRKIRKQEQIMPYKVILIDGKNHISQTNCEIIIGCSQNSKIIYKNSILLSIDFDKIQGSLYARRRLEGDKITVGGMNKSVKKMMCDKKIPIAIRDRTPIICDDGGIIAIPSVTVCDRVHANKHTVHQLYITVTINDNE